MFQAAVAENYKVFSTEMFTNELIIVDVFTTYNYTAIHFLPPFSGLIV